MLNARRESRVEVLQDACVVLQSEVVRLSTRLQEQAELLARLEGRALTQEELNDLLAPVLSSEADRESEETPAPAEKKTRKAKRGHGPRPQLSLPIDEVWHELSPEERRCDVCQGELEEMGSVSEDTEEITVVERSYRLTVHRRRKYRCRCNAKVKTAPGPVRGLRSGRYSLDFQIHTALEKYLDHIPLERQVTRMAREGLSVTSQTLWDQIDGLAKHLEPTYDAIKAAVTKEPVVHADETGWMLAEGRRKKGRKRHRKKATRATAWVLSSPRLCCFALLGSKSHAAGLSLLKDYRGTLVADGYQVYETLSRGDPGDEERRFRLVNCWAHCLRRYRDIEDNDPRCSQILHWIGDLYEIEREIEGPFPGKESVCCERLRLRQEKSRPILEKIKMWSYEQGGLRRSDFGRALAYMMERWEGLTAFVEDGRIPLDNNHAERELRHLVLGRKNHFGSRSKRGAKVAAIVYSLVQTAKLNGIDPAQYFRVVAQRAIAVPATATLPESLTLQQ